MSQAVGDLSSEVRAAITARLEDAPVRIGLVFGSHATGHATAGSDIDIAVAYADDADVDAADAHLSLVADLTRALDRDDIDVVRLDAVDPRIAVEALDHGTLLVGTEEAVEQFRDRLDAPRRRREEIVDDRIAAAERGIEHRLQRREHGG